MVTTSPFTVDFLSPSIIDRRDHVRDTPEVRRINVFKRGTDQGLKGIIPIDGNTQPISTLGARLA